MTVAFILLIIYSSINNNPFYGHDRNAIYSSCPNKYKKFSFDCLKNQSLVTFGPR